MRDAQNTSNQPSKPSCHNKFVGCEGYQASLIGQIKDSMIPIKGQGLANRCKSCPTQYKIIRREITTIKHTGFQHAAEANQHKHTGPNNNINNQLQRPLPRERDTWGVIPDTITLRYIAEIYRLLYIEWQFEINKVYHGEGLSICFPFIRRVTECYGVERLSIHPCTSILECRINIDRGRSNPRLPSIKGPKHQGLIPVPW